MIGQLVLHYRIIEKLGEGGMGVVYKAYDTKLERLVAIKFLARHISSSVAMRDRLMIEARSAGLLNHPNIATIYAIEEDNEELFIVMEFIDGKELKQKIKKETLSEDVAIKIAVKISSALEEAHNKGIVHRDVKSTNIMLTQDGGIKITDFGLAKHATPSGLTKTGVIVGTAAYMSPEQTQGVGVDHRSDIWSLGVVLYEMVTGRLPFGGDYDHAILYSILNMEPQSISEINKEVSPAFEQIVKKCLSKDVNKRYQSMSELLVDFHSLLNNDLSKSADRVSLRFLKAVEPVIRRRFLWGVGGILLIVSSIIWISDLFETKSGAPGEKMLLILPFENIGPTEKGYFADGVTNELIARMSMIKGLGVFSRTTSFLRKRREVSEIEFGKEIGADYILTGNIHWQPSTNAPDIIRVIPELIKVSTKNSIWTTMYDLDPTDILEIQTSIARKTIDALNITLSEKENIALDYVSTTNLEAYNQYLLGNHLYYKLDASADDKVHALDFFHEAVKKDTNFVEAYSMLAVVNSNLYRHERSYKSWSPSFGAQALFAGIKAVELDSTIPASHIAMGSFYYNVVNDYEKALNHFQIAQSLRPSNVRILASMAYIYRRRGAYDSAIKNLAQAQRLEPKSARRAYELAITHHWMRNYASAEEFYDLAIRLDPDWDEPYRFKAILYLSWSGDIEEAWGVIEELPPRVAEKITPSALFYQPVWYDLSVMEMNFEAAVRNLRKHRLMISDIHYYGSLATLYGYLNQQSLKKAYFDSLFARSSRNKHRALAYAGLGNRDSAIAIINDLSIPEDRFTFGPHDQEYLAWVYTLLGERDSAIDLLDQLLSSPGPISVAKILIDPKWEPLKEDPRFQWLINKYSD